MGNGRRLGASSGRSLKSSLGRVRPLGALLVLLLAGAVLLGSGSRRYAQKAAVQTPVSNGATSSMSSLRSKPDARALLAQLPLIFEPNQGQADPSVKFLAHGAGYGLFLETTGAVFSMQTPHSSRTGSTAQLVRMTLVGGNRAAATVGQDPLPGKSNYILGNDPHKWHSGIPQFAGVRYESIYPGIDLVFYGNQGHMEYDFRVAPGADPAQAELQFDGASKLEVNGGELILTGENDGNLRMQAPQVYQRDGDRRQPVAGRFVLRAANRVGFEIGSYDRSRELIIDPSLNFSTYFGGSGTETSPSVAVNGNGDIYIVGTTQGSPVSTSATTFPTTPVLTLFPTTLSLTTSSPPHIFVAEISPSQPAVLYETFIGGSGSDSSVGIGVDNGGNAYIVGNTTSPDFPTGGVPYETAPETKGSQCSSITCSSVFVTVLNPSGTAPLIYSTYLSGNGNDIASGMTIDLNRDVFVTGTTTSNDSPSLIPADDFPATLLPVPYQVSPASSLQFFVTKVNTAIPGTGSIAYSTYFGGAVPTPAVAVGGGIAVDSNGNIYFSGTTNFYNSGSGAYGDSGVSGDFPIINAYQPCLDTIPPLVLQNPNPCTAPMTTPYATDAFIAKLNPNYVQTGGAPLLFSTYLGGMGADSSTGIALNFGAASIYLTGTTNSPDFYIPTGTQPFQSCLNNGNPIGSTAACTTQNTTNTDAFVARMSNPTPTTTGVPADVALTYFSYLGGSGNDSGQAITVFQTSTAVSDALITGTTNSTNLPVTTGAIQSALGTGATQNAFLAQIDTTTTTGQTGESYVTYFGGNGLDIGTGIAVDTNFNTYLVGSTTSTNFEQENSLQPTGLNGPSDAFVAKFVPTNALSLTSVAATVSPQGTVGVGNPVTITFTIANEGPDPATNIFVNGTVPTTGVTFDSASAGSGTCSAPSGNVVTCQIPSLQVGATSQVVFTVTPTVSGNYSATGTVTNVNNTTTNVSASASFTSSAFGLAPVTPSSITVSAGLAAVYAVNVYPINGVFNNNISLSCSSLPVGAACNFQTSTITLTNGSNSASTMLNVTTTAQPVTTLASAGWRRSFYALWLMVPGMAVLGLGSRGNRRRGRMLALLAFCVLFTLVFLQPSCSTPKTQPQVSGTPSGTYSLKVTATSGSLSQSQPFQLTVVP
jgi:hypothetical protein